MCLLFTDGEGDGQVSLLEGVSEEDDRLRAYVEEIRPDPKHNKGDKQHLEVEECADEDDKEPRQQIVHLERAEVRPDALGEACRRGEAVLALVPDELPPRLHRARHLLGHSRLGLLLEHARERRKK